MFDPEFLKSLTHAMGVTVVSAPALLFALLGLLALAGRAPSELAISRIVHVAVTAGLLPALAILALMLTAGMRQLPIDIGHWVAIPHFDFWMKFEFDRLNVPFVILTFVLCGTIAAFATRYMHRERGYARFFVLLSLFQLGMVLTSLASTIETLFVGWELVGLSSALLVAFFHERAAPVRNGLRVWIVYRISDAALLLASVVAHHLTGGGDFDKFLGTAPWPEGQTSLTEHQALIVGLLLLVAAAGKSALIPFSGWLPRAMEGPTPSSAVFYGALSVHLGAYLLLRVSPILDVSPTLCAAVAILGLVTALFATLAGRVQTDIKGALAFASLTQVGIITTEIACGLRYLALIHILGHACLRTLQFLRAPSLLRDYHTLENAIGDRLPDPQATRLGQRASERWRDWFYRLSLERGYLDGLLSDCVARPFVRVFECCDHLERCWTDTLAGRPAHPAFQDDSSPERLDDLR